MPDEHGGRPVVCVDFNGVLDVYSGWRGPRHFDPPRPGVREFLDALGRSGFTVVVFTTRHPADVWRWLDAHGLIGFIADVTDRKPAAHVFIDDRAICFEGDFERTLAQVRRFSAHWERTPPEERS